MENDQEAVEAFHYWRDDLPLRTAVCVLMREFGEYQPDYPESDDECIDAYLWHDHGEQQLKLFETLAKEILEQPLTQIEELKAENGRLREALAHLLRCSSSPVTEEQAFEKFAAQVLANEVLSADSPPTEGV